MTVFLFLFSRWFWWGALVSFIGCQDDSHWLLLLLSDPAFSFVFLHLMPWNTWIYVKLCLSLSRIFLKAWNQKWVRNRNRFSEIYHFASRRKRHTLNCSWTGLCPDLWGLFFFSFFFDAVVYRDPQATLSPNQIYLYPLLVWALRAQ